MHPAFEHPAGTGGTDEAEALHFDFQLWLDRGADVEIAGGQGAGGPEFGGGATDENWARKAALMERFADARKEAEGGFEFRTVVALHCGRESSATRHPTRRSPPP